MSKLARHLDIDIEFSSWGNLAPPPRQPGCVLRGMQHAGERRPSEHRAGAARPCRSAPRADDGCGEVTPAHVPDADPDVARGAAGRGRGNDDAGDRHRRHVAAAVRGPDAHRRCRQPDPTIPRGTHATGHSRAVPRRGAERRRGAEASGVPDGDRIGLDVEPRPREADDRDRPWADDADGVSPCAVAGAGHRLRPPLGACPRDLRRRPDAGGDDGCCVRRGPAGRRPVAGGARHGQALHGVRTRAGWAQRRVVRGRTPVHPRRRRLPGRGGDQRRRAAIGDERVRRRGWHPRRGQP